MTKANVELDHIKVRWHDGSIVKAAMGYVKLDQDVREEGEQLVFYSRSRYFDRYGKLELTTPWKGISSITNWKPQAPAPKSLFTRIAGWLHGK